MLKKIIDNNPDFDFLIIEGFDNCVIGIEYNKNVLIYSMEKMLLKLNETMTETEAIEHLTTNITDNYLGKKTPLFLWV